MGRRTYGLDLHNYARLVSDFVGRGPQRGGGVDAFDAAYKVRIGGFNGDWGTGVLTLDYGPRSQTSLEDFAAFARCFTGPCESGPCNFSNEPCCAVQDFNADADVDLDDYARFHAILVGP